MWAQPSQPLPSNTWTSYPSPGGWAWGVPELPLSWLLGVQGRSPSLCCAVLCCRVAHIPQGGKHWSVLVESFSCWDPAGCLLWALQLDIRL